MQFLSSNRKNYLFSKPRNLVGNLPCHVFNPASPGVLDPVTNLPGERGSHVIS